MRVTQKEKKQLISTVSSFLKVVELGEKHTALEIQYSVLLAEVLRRKLSTVRVTLSPPAGPTPSLIDGTSGDSDKIVTGILTGYSLVRDSVKKKSAAVIKTYDSDITRAISNSSTSASDPTSAKTVLRAVPSASVKSSIVGTNRLAHVPTPDRTAQFLATKLLVDEFDPAMVTKIGAQVTTVRDLVAGVMKHVRTQLSSYDDQLAYLKAISSATTPVITVSGTSTEVISEQQSEVLLVDVVDIPVRIDSLSEISVTFELLNADGSVFSSLARTVKTSRVVASAANVCVPPSLSVGTSETGACVVQVKQLDRAGKFVSLYKRDVFDSLLDAEAKYELLTTRKLSSADGVLVAELDVGFASSIIVRAVGSGSDAELTSGEFSGVVVRRDAKAMRQTFSSLTSRPTSEGVSIDLRNIPYDVVSVAIKRRDAMGAASEWETLTVFSVADRRDVYPFTDTTVLQGRTYEYTCDLSTAGGSVLRGSTEIVEFRSVSTKLVDTRIESLSVSQSDDDIDVAFKITSSIVPKTLELTRAAMVEQGLADFYTDELLSARESLQALIAHSVTRVNMLTGERESFGVQLSGDFSDSAVGPSLGVSALKRGVTYRYEVTALLRHPETMLPDYVKTATDGRSKRSYAFKPAKFKHPVVFSDGSITTPGSLTRNHSKDQFSFGNTGNYVCVDVPISAPTPTITTPSASQVDAETIEIVWKVISSISSIDHFLIFKCSSDGRELVGKTHTFFDGDFSFVYRISPADVGDITFVVFPIFADFSRGQELSTNHIFIAESDGLHRRRPTRVTGY